MIRNRDQWTIDQVHRNGDLAVHGRTDTVRLPHAAYIATAGEDTALDIFADAITSSWIDQPALARQAELAGHNRKRPGTLPADQLRGLLDQQAQLTTTLDQLRTDLDELPRDHQWTRHDRDRATQKLDATTARLQATHDTIAQHDRPFRRKGHENAIRNAHKAVDTLGVRPKGGQPSRAWDNAAGRLDQHQTAFDLTKELGPTKGRKLPMGFFFSRALAAGDQRNIEQAINRERQQARQIEGPALRIR